MPDTSSKKWAFDTNVLVYLLDDSSFYHQAAVRAVSVATKTQKKITIAQQMMIELVETLERDYHLPKKVVHQQVLYLTQMIPLLISPKTTTLRIFLDLYRQLATVKDHFDLYLAATLLDNDVRILVTNDRKGFKGIPGLTVLSLADF